EVEPGLYDEQALRVRAGVRHARAVVREGLAWAQDEAAQLVPRLFGTGRVERIVDLCAAPGTKTRQLAEGLAPGGVLLAVDRHAGRLGRLLR
ncbi:MAG: hypothetical protein GWN07_02640, partial [Actinobacteria bacterium]|nr:hypothetical protein [Actinomycetota bacterium]